MSSIRKQDANDQQLIPLNLPSSDQLPVRLGKLYGSAYGLCIAELVEQFNGLVVVITNDSANTRKLASETKFYSNNTCPITLFPDWETLPYDWFSPHEEIISQRLLTLTKLPKQKKGVLIVPVSTLMHYIAPKEFIDRYSLVLSKGQALNMAEFRLTLEQSGYQYVSEVSEYGDFTTRGSLIDLYPMGAPSPYRIDLFDTEIESIRTFDPETQRTIKQLEQIKLLPGREFPLSEQAILLFRKQYRSELEGDPNKSVIYRDISQGLIPAGTEYYLPLFYEQTATLFDYLPESTLIVCADDIIEAAKNFDEQVSDRYEQRRHDISRPILKPSKLFITVEQLQQNINNYRRIYLQHYELEKEIAGQVINCNTQAPAQLLIQAKAQDPILTLRNYIANYSGRICFMAESTGRREFILELFKAHQLKPQVFNNWFEFLESKVNLGILVAALDQGLSILNPEISLISESQLFGTRAHKQYKRQKHSQDQDSIIQSLTDLSIGSPVVHIEHGVGRYLGLKKIDVNGNETEFLLLEYAEGDKLYVPVSSLHFISRYTGASPENAPLHKLGNEQWARAKRKASQRVKDIAVQLLDIYSRRAAQKGHAYTIDQNEYKQFASSFPFEETPDQEAAIKSVLSDMAGEQPMDRVICGDVGFGKTEVAMRAAFVSVQEGLQVAILVPTTLLAQQHYQNFADRFADWPVKINVLSRFKSKKETTEIIKQLATGQTDIIIGTHKLIQKNIKFKNLGLLILDEEHRFGVQQKEQLKALRSKIDVLTMTATPIPRTLNMSLSGLRDLSIIATPPVQRVAIKTFVNQWNKALIQEAILREIKRGGQVYFLHNKVQTIEKTAADLAEIVPEAAIKIAHGQMRERELEQVMLDFYHQRFNVLVCTTIIESGIDIPTANTIIINRADLLGLAQLHQLRGRVGRSHHRAYAYLIVPEKRSMTADAIKRIEAIESLENLGSGFMLATHDLEIRGAGELLGEEQSGQIHEIGFSLYMELLERAIKALKSGQSIDLDKPIETGPEIELNIPALIDESYLPDIHARLIMYKRIANARNSQTLKELQIEMIDRFGLLPENCKNLFAITELKLRAEAIGIKKISANDQQARLVFAEKPNINYTKLMQLIQTKNDQYKLDGQNKLRLSYNSNDRDQLLEMLNKALDSITTD